MSRIYLSKELKDLVFDRANFLCEYCLSPDDYSSSPFNIEHIIPISKSGTNEIENLALACQGCNLHKYNNIFGIDPESGVLAAFYNPRENNWKDHFIWNENHTIIIGQTPIGRATVNSLYLNRYRLINQRNAFIKLGIHPPKFTIV